MYSVKSAQTAGISNARGRDNKCRGNSPQSHVRLWRSAWRGVWEAETAPVIREQSPVWDSWSADDHLKMCLGDELYSVWGFQHCWIWGVTFHHMENVTWGVNVLLLSTHSTCRLLPPSHSGSIAAHLSCLGDCTTFWHAFNIKKNTWVITFIFCPFFGLLKLRITPPSRTGMIVQWLSTCWANMRMRA